MQIKIAVVAGLIVGLSGSVLGKDTSASAPDCQTLRDAGKRLACFDKLSKQSAKSDQPVPPPEKGWTKEPDSFLSVKLGAKIEESISTICPTRTERLDDISGSKFGEMVSLDYGAWVNAGRPLCYFYKYPSFGKIKGHSLKGLEELDFSLEDPYGIVGKVRARIFNSNFSEFKAAAIDRFGPPTVTTNGVFRLVNGREFPNEQNYWIGKNITISVMSYVEREVSRVAVIDYAEMVGATNAFLAKSNAKIDKEVQDKASKF